MKLGRKERTFLTFMKDQEVTEQATGEIARVKQEMKLERQPEARS